jgi:DNA-binding CsgD family transcriptional regulator
MDALDRIRCGGLIVNRKRQILAINQIATRLLEQEVGELAKSDPDWARRAIERLLGRASSRLTMSVDTWVMIHRETKRPLAVHSVPLEDQSNAVAYAVIIFVDPDTIMEPNMSVLERMFELTPAEAKLAIQISRGETPIDIARTNCVTIATVRSQLAAVFAKTGTQRQAELVALLARVSILPSPLQSALTVVRPGKCTGTRAAASIA